MLEAWSESSFCCLGCKAVYELLHRSGLAHYYELRDGEGTPVVLDPDRATDDKWLEPIEQALHASPGGRAVELDIQGMRCAACVWLMQELFDRQPGAGHIDVNPGLGRLRLLVDQEFPLRRFVRELARFGYGVGPARKTSSRSHDDLLVRLGIVVALAANSMMFAIAIYLGLDAGPVYELMRQLEFALAAVAVLVGGSVFIRSAWHGVRRGVIHLDTPIAVGIVLAFAGSAWAFWRREDGALYLDSVSVFVALMLVGRWLQERVVARNQRHLLESEGVDELLTRRIDDGRVVLVHATDVRVDDELLIAPSDLVPVPAISCVERAQCSYDWINGESAPREVREGEEIPAGAFNVGSSAIRVRAIATLDGSALATLLRASPRAIAGSEARWQRVSSFYVLGVLLLAASGFAGWWLVGGSALRGVEVATAILVVTCPCAFGIATPLAYELVLAGLRRSGLFVRERSFVDRIQYVRKVLFDKTGTLTSGALCVADDRALASLSPHDRQALYDLAARSAHPKSQAIVRALSRWSLRLTEDLTVIERPGCGMEGRGTGGSIEGPGVERRYRLGAEAWACERLGAEGDHDLVFTRDGQPLAYIETIEALRPDAPSEIARLERLGCSLFVLSGDLPHRVHALAERLGIDPGHRYGGLSPTDKAHIVRSLDHRDTLFVGDGINDSLAVTVAYCSGTPALDRPFMPARTDFYLVTPGLGPLAMALRAGGALAQTVRRNWGIAITYNALAVGLAMGGWMQPWLAAVLMPASSIVILTMTSWRLSSRSRLWKS